MSATRCLKINTARPQNRGQTKASHRGQAELTQPLPLAANGVQIAERFEMMIRAYLDAVSAKTVLEAQQAAQRAQQNLDAAGTVAGELAAGLAYADLDTTSVDALIRSVLAVSLAHTGDTLVDYLSRAEARITGLLGIADPEPSAALQFLLTEQVAGSSLDSELFVTKFVTAFQLLDPHQTTLAALVAAQPAILADFHDSQTATFNSLWNVKHILDHAQTTRQGAEGILNVVCDLVEGQGAFVARVLLLATGVKQRPYLKLKAGYATDDIRRAREEPKFEPLLAGLNLHLRSAKSHNTVTYGSEVLVATSGGNQITVTYDELVDEVLEAIESTSACLLALRQVLDRAGIAMDEYATAEEIGLSLEELGAIVIGSLTGLATSVQINDDTIHLRLEGGDTDWALSSLMVALGPLLDRASRFRARHTQADGSSRVLAGPTVVLCDYPMEASDFDKQVHCVHLSLMLTVNRAPAIDSGQVRKFCAVKAAEALLADDKPESGRQLRALTGLAAETYDTDLDNVLRAARRYLRLGNQAGAEFIDQLESWRDDPVDWEAP